MDPELKYTQIQLKECRPQLMGIIQEEPQEEPREEPITASETNSRRESIAIHPTCDCSNCCCYLCCGCPELYTPDEMLINNTRLTLCPLTSRVFNPMLAPTTNGNKPTNIHPAFCLISPMALIADIILVIPRTIIHACSVSK